MKKYKVYLTKSHAVAELIAEAHKLGKENGIYSKGFGPANMCSEVPDVYKNRKYFAAVIVYYEDAPVEPYELIIA